jgi:hypothetical protein
MAKSMPTGLAIDGNMTDNQSVPSMAKPEK